MLDYQKIYNEYTTHPQSLITIKSNCKIKNPFRQLHHHLHSARK